ncbi:hypothetical protein [Thermogymnomonas acidicola]|uniref:hypothetical protein n=1 Tax=Thermogymnomonas acidicola TaxID=399579 RepID=UPI001396BDE3|nr:hypothetical protein [Thermogymnomonas acidicola]
MERGSAPRLFGTNGIRGVPNRDLTVEFAQSIGKSIGTFFRAREVAMGRDTRLSGQMIMGAVQSGLNSTGGTDTVDLGILPTPALQYYCKNTGMPGVMITASHNPPQYNGIKCIDSDGSELAREKEREIEVIHHSGQFHSADWNSVGGRNRWDSTAEELYVRGGWRPGYLWTGSGPLPSGWRWTRATVHLIGRALNYCPGTGGHRSRP